jgi:hypothetical protein
MAISWSRAREAIEKIKRHRDKCLVIHYACQSLYDDREGLSPSISNIVVQDYGNGQTVSFAAHITAEKLGISKDDITAKFDQIEAALLEEFYEFVRAHNGDLWVHWNMINIQYGFEVLAHRYYILTKKNAPGIDIDNRVNVAAILMGKYGEKYVSVPHMPNLMKLNGGVRKDFILGKDEVEVFRAGEYARLHASTVAKVKFFVDVIDLIIDNKLKTEKATFAVKIERSLDSIAAKAIGLLAALYTIIDITLKVLEHTEKHPR